MRSNDQQDNVRHCEMSVGDSLIIMRSPPGRKAPVEPITVGLYVHVDDVDAP